MIYVLNYGLMEEVEDLLADPVQPDLEMVSQPSFTYVVDEEHYEAALKRLKEIVIDEVVAGNGPLTRGRWVSDAWDKSNRRAFRLLDDGDPVAQIIVERTELNKGLAIDR